MTLMHALTLKPPAPIWLMDRIHVSTYISNIFELNDMIYIIEQWGDGVDGNFSCLETDSESHMISNQSACIIY